MIGAAIWAVGITLLGFFLGKEIGAENIDKYLLPIVAVIIVLSLIPPFLEWRKHRKRGRRAGRSQGLIVRNRGWPLPTTPDPQRSRRQVMIGSGMRSAVSSPFSGPPCSVAPPRFEKRIDVEQHDQRDTGDRPTRAVVVPQG